MQLPGILLENSVEEGKIYLFRDNCPIGVKGHMHVCIKIHDRVYLFSNCTSQMKTIRRHAELTGISLDTYPCFPADNVNQFKELTFINCNNVFECSADEFVQYLDNQYIIPLGGSISAEGMSAIAKGIKLSKTVAKEVQDLF